MEERRVLDSWKEIAAYLGRSVKTCRRWEHELGLPIHRLEESPKARVFAYPEGLDQWIKTIQKSEDSQKRSIRRNIQFLVPILVLVLFGVALIIWQLIPQKEVYFPKKIENSIAVISFENLTGEPQYNDLAKAVSNLLITKFEAMGVSYVTTWERQQDILKQMGKNPETAVDTNLGFEICRRDGVVALAVGRITKAGDIFATDLKILDVETKKSLISATSNGDGVGSILKFQIDELALNIAQGLGWNVQAAKEAAPIAEVTTSSAEAYQYYLSGVSARFKFYNEEARQHLLKSVERDPDFASAYLELANAYFGLGLDKERNEAVEKALSLIDKANPKEQLYIQEAYALYVENNGDKEIQILKQIIENYPKEKQAHYYLGISYHLKQLWDKSIREFQTSIELDPYCKRALYWISITCLKKGEYDDALEYAKRYADAAPNEANPLNALGEIYCRMGQFDLAIEQFKKALDIKPDFVDSHKRALPSLKYGGCALKTFYEYWTGAYKKALNDLAKLWTENNLDQKEKIGGGSALYDYYNMKSLVSLAQRDFKRYREEVRRSNDALVGCGPENTKFGLDLGTEIQSAYSECLEGRPNAARERMTKVESLLPQLQGRPMYVGELINRMLEYLKAKILLAENSWDEAISILEQLSPAFVVDYLNSARIAEANTLFYHEMDLAYAYEMKGEIEKAIDILEDIVHFDPADKDLRLTPPKAYYNLGRLYEKKDMKKRAKENLEKFLKLWKDADPGIIEVEDARKRLEGLKAPQ
jgi:tetratricopeptide (TPR) repeat protein